MFDLKKTSVLEQAPLLRDENFRQVVSGIMHLGVTHFQLGRANACGIMGGFRLVQIQLDDMRPSRERKATTRRARSASTLSVEATVSRLPRLPRRPKASVGALNKRLADCNRAARRRLTRLATFEERIAKQSVN